ncbi:uncharacterized protein LOC144434315 [Glandiceps talaboti]
MTDLLPKEDGNCSPVECNDSSAASGRRERRKLAYPRTGSTHLRPVTMTTPKRLDHLVLMGRKDVIKAINDEQNNCFEEYAERELSSEPPTLVCDHQYLTREISQSIPRQVSKVRPNSCPLQRTNENYFLMNTANRPHSAQQNGAVLRKFAMSAGFVLPSRTGSTNSNRSKGSIQNGRNSALLDEALSRVRNESRTRRLKRMGQEERKEMLKKHHPSCKTAEYLVKWLQEKRKTDEDLDLIAYKKAQARRKFRRVIRLVWLLCSYKIRMKKLSLEKTIQTATELHFHTLYNSKEAEEIAFNKAWFQKGPKEFSRVPNWAKDIIQKPTLQRTDGELRQLHALLRGLRSFDKFTHTIQMAMCKSFSYEIIEPRRVILRKGHIGQNFYFIYSGSVFVNTEERHPVTGKIFTKTEAVLARGDSFGELALLRDIKRTATISSRDTCELLVVDREIFSEICPRIFDQELETKVQFLGNLSIFHKYWSVESLKSLCAESQIQEFKTNRVVTADCMEDDSVYICMEGRCRILKYLLLDDVCVDEEDSCREEIVDLAILLTEQTMEKKMFKREDFKDERKARIDQKNNMLSAMHLEYADRPYAKGEVEVAELDESGNAVLKESSTPNASSMIDRDSLISNMSLSSFMKIQTRKMGKRDLVYLDVGVLKASQIFNLEEILNPTLEKKGLILVSNGANLIRIKRPLLLKLASSEAMEFARNIASQYSYPSQRVLENSYGEHSRWEEYKRGVVYDTLTSAGKDLSISDQERRRIRSNMRSRDNRLKSTLERQQQDMQMLTLCSDDDSAEKRRSSRLWTRFEDYLDEDNPAERPSTSGQYDSEFMVPLRGGGFLRRQNSLLVKEIIKPKVLLPSNANIVVDPVTQVRFN